MSLCGLTGSADLLEDVADAELYASSATYVANRGRAVGFVVAAKDGTAGKDKQMPGQGQVQGLVLTSTREPALQVVKAVARLFVMLEEKLVG